VTKSKVVTVSIIVAAVLSGAVVGHFMTNEQTSAGSPKSTSPVRQFYLTKSAVPGGSALKACAAEYHMASFWEIMDVATLQYDTTLGATASDSGNGPPVEVPDSSGSYVHADGWVRTGGMAMTNGLNTGSSNCSGWTSASANDNGTVIGLNSLWQEESTGSGTMPIAPWWRATLSSNNVTPPQCSVPHGVWCASN
jgi:hypothetical protein